MDQGHLNIPKGCVTLSEFFRLRPELAIAWDRDVPSDHPWAMQEDCACDNCIPPYVHFSNADPLRYHNQPFVTDGHGSLYQWVVDSDCSLGGFWIGMGNPFIHMKDGTIKNFKSSEFTSVSLSYPSWYPFCVSVDQ